MQAIVMVLAGIWDSGSQPRAITVPISPSFGQVVPFSVMQLFNLCNFSLKISSESTGAQLPSEETQLKHQSCDAATFPSPWLFAT